MAIGARDQGPFLREWRKYRGLTLTELAERVGTTQATLSRYETGARRITTETLQKFANALVPARQIGELFIKPPAWDLREAIGRSAKIANRARKAQKEDVDAKLARLSREAASNLRADELLKIWLELTPHQRRLLIEIAKTIRSAG
jgi:transcriptional regulator with XRE-family HTH domain